MFSADEKSFVVVSFFVSFVVVSFFVSLFVVSLFVSSLDVEDVREDHRAPIFGFGCALARWGTKSHGKDGFTGDGDDGKSDFFASVRSSDARTAIVDRASTNMSRQCVKILDETRPDESTIWRTPNIYNIYDFTRVSDA
jgi:hypothetical protein